MFFWFSLQRRKGPRICRHAESCGMFLCMFLYSHEYILCTVMIQDTILLYCRKRFHAQSLFWAHLIFILITECSTSCIHLLFNYLCIYIYIYHISHTVSLSLYIYTYPYMCIYANILYHAIHSIF